MWFIVDKISCMFHILVLDDTLHLSRIWERYSIGCQSRQWDGDARVVGRPTSRV